MTDEPRMKPIIHNLGEAGPLRDAMTPEEFEEAFFMMKDEWFASDDLLEGLGFPAHVKHPEYGTKYMTLDERIEAAVEAARSEE